MGFDRKRFPNIQQIEQFCKYAICSICLDVLEEPKKLSDCLHCVCFKTCLRGIQDKDGNFVCPECRTVSKAFEDPHTFFAVSYNEIGIYCRWRSLGCQATTTIGDEEQHARLCEDRGNVVKQCNKCDFIGPFMVEDKAHDCTEYLKDKCQVYQETIRELEAETQRIKTNYKQMIQQIKDERDKDLDNSFQQMARLEQQIKEYEDRIADGSLAEMTAEESVFLLIHRTGERIKEEMMASHPDQTMEDGSGDH